MRITLDTDSVSGWNEIDAVSITGSHNSLGLKLRGGFRHGSSVGKWGKASSQYREDRWTPEQMTGIPDVYPKYGDYDTAWVASTSDGGGGVG